jgi:protein-disulfide isomerase
LIREVAAAYPEKIRVIFKNLPMDFHPHAILAHEAALAAGVEGKFWEMHDLILSNQSALTRADLLSYAKRLGLDAARFASRLDSEESRAVIAGDLAEAKTRGVFGAPAFFVNDKRLDGVQPVGRFKEVIQNELSQPQTAAKSQ